MTRTASTLTNVYGSYLICASSNGSYRWFAVHSHQEAHPINACWIALNAERLEQLRSRGVHSDGCARFFQTKRELIAALNGN
jgi:hypothetical protein